jgi:AcrR family transcriptional regulator
LASSIISLPKQNYYSNQKSKIFMDKVTAKKEEIIQQVSQHLIQSGLSDVTLRTLANVANTSDRMLIYYFDTKDGLLKATLTTIANNFASQLDTVLGQHQRPAETLLSELLALNKVPQFNLMICLWFEIVGLAVRGQEPYAQTALTIARDWEVWIESKLIQPQLGQARHLFAELEGRLMLEAIGLGDSA